MLKKSNYEIKSLGIVLSEAFAKIIKTEKLGESGYAIIGVQSSRENVEKMLKGEIKPIEQHRVDFIVNRKQNDFETAYIESKKPKYIETIWNKDSNKFEKVYEDSVFADWENEIE